MASGVKPSLVGIVRRSRPDRKPPDWLRSFAAAACPCCRYTAHRRDSCRRTSAGWRSSSSATYGGRIPFSTVSTVVGCGKEFGYERVLPVPWIREVDGRRQLPRLRPRQRAQRSLQRTAHAVGEPVIEDSVSRADGGVPLTGRVPREPNARHQTLPVHRRDAVRHARVAGKQQARRSVREHRRLLGPAPRRSSGCGYR